MKKAKITDKSKFAQRVKKEFLKGPWGEEFIKTYEETANSRICGGDGQNISCWQQRQ